MAFAAVTCKFCGKPMLMSGAPNIPKDVTIEASWKLHMVCPFCKKEADYPASALKTVFRQDNSQ
jgi:hypothetical protein